MSGIRLSSLRVEGYSVSPQQAITEAVEKSIAKANEHFPGHNFQVPEIDFSLKGACAGKAFLNRWLIQFNLNYMSSHWEDMISETTPHEVAHLIAHRVYGPSISAHGSEWFYVARLLGCSGDRCHSYEVVPARQTRKFLYHCKCLRGVKVGLNVHRKIQDGDTRYCVHCRTTLGRMTSYQELED